MEKALQKLPQEYRQIEIIDLQKNKKQALLVNGLAAAIMVVMMFGMNAKISFIDWLDSLEGSQPIVRMIVVAVAYVLYIIAHELTHGITMKLMGGKMVKYGFTGLYAFAGSEKDYFNRKPYICIALAPVVVWGIIFLVLQLVLPFSWAWVIYFLQMGNISGAAGDLYVTARMLRMPDTVYVMDTGVNMTVYDK